MIRRTSSQPNAATIASEHYLQQDRHRHLFRQAIQSPRVRGENLMGRAVKPNRQLTRVGTARPKAAEWLKAINAVQRRRILRTLHNFGEARSPNELAKTFEVSVSHISYHIKVLKECKALALTDTRPARGAVEHFYASTVMDDRLVLELLEATEADDG